MTKVNLVGYGETAGASRRGPRAIARQPVFDRHRHLVGFELLYRGAWDGAVDQDTATLRTMAVALAQVGIQNAVGPHQSFFHMTPRLVAERWHHALAPRQTVLQLLDVGPPVARTVEVIENARAEGYRICLDRYPESPADQWVLCHVDLVNVDVQRMTLTEMAATVEVIHRRGARAIAERIEDGPTMAAARQAEFDYLKGFHLGLPERVTGQPIHCPIVLLKTLEETVLDPEATPAEIAELLDRDEDVRAAVRRVAAATPRFDDETVRRIAHLVALAAEPAPEDEPAATAVSPADCHWVVEPA